jgi:hypothetical protein
VLNPLSTFCPTASRFSEQQHDLSLVQKHYLLHLVAGPLVLMNSPSSQAGVITSRKDLRVAQPSDGCHAALMSALQPTIYTLKSKSICPKVSAGYKSAARVLFQILLVRLYWCRTRFCKPAWFARIRVHSERKRRIVPLYLRLSDPITLGRTKNLTASEGVLSVQRLSLIGLIYQFPIVLQFNPPVV